jgi:hypothetical protein
VKIVPLVVYNGEERLVVGEARVDSDGNMTGIVKNKDIAQMIQPTGCRFSLVAEPDPSILARWQERIAKASP